MLQTIAKALLENFNAEEVFRIGGDEFVVLSGNITRGTMVHKIDNLTGDIAKRGYSLSLGYEWRDTELDINGIIQAAETAMQKNKREYYMSGNGGTVREPRSRMETRE